MRGRAQLQRRVPTIVGGGHRPEPAVGLQQHGFLAGCKVCPGPRRGATGRRADQCSGRMARRRGAARRDRYGAIGWHVGRRGGAKVVAVGTREGERLLAASAQRLAVDLPGTARGEPNAAEAAIEGGLSGLPSWPTRAAAFKEEAQYTASDSVAHSMFIRGTLRPPGTHLHVSSELYRRWAAARAEGAFHHALRMQVVKVSNSAVEGAVQRAVEAAAAVACG